MYRDTYMNEVEDNTGRKTFVLLAIQLWFIFFKKWDSLYLYFYFSLNPLHVGDSSTSTSSIIIPARKNRAY